MFTLLIISANVLSNTKKCYFTLTPEAAQNCVYTIVIYIFCKDFNYWQ